MRIIVTEANTKHSIALQRELCKIENVELIANDEDSVLIARLYGYCDLYSRDLLEDVVRKVKPDFIIPVGAKSVLKCSKYFQEITLLPPFEALDFVLNKKNLEIFNKIDGVNYPATKSIKSFEDLLNFSKVGSVVVKTNNESSKKIDPIYFNHENINDVDRLQLKRLIDSNIELIVQERVVGVGRGFFCLAYKGAILEYYMHERIREFPVTGGSSTAAKSIFCEQLYKISKEIIDQLNWTGPLMIEFKYDDENRKYFLIEINPKFWGSLELSYTLGFSFGKNLIQLYKYHSLDNVKKSYEIDVKFYWILDGDIVNLFKTREYMKFFQYFEKKAYNNLFKSILADIVKLLWTVKKLF